MLISVRHADRKGILDVARALVGQGYAIAATRGTADWLEQNGIVCARVNKVAEGRPDVVDAIKNGEFVLIINTAEGRQAIADSFTIRREALQQKVTYTTTLDGARATCLALARSGHEDVRRLQDLHPLVEVAAVAGARRSQQGTVA